jgi:choline dehydrogenase-like flavoprotein
MSDSDLDFDFIVIGSGFGGSVSALRLTEKGYRVAVMEMGRRWRAEDTDGMTDGTRADRFPRLADRRRLNRNVNSSR